MPIANARPQPFDAARHVALIDSQDVSGGITRPASTLTVAAAAERPMKMIPHHAAIWSEWISLLNGDLRRAERLLGPDCRLHMPLVPGLGLAAMDGPVGFVQWISRLHTLVMPLSVVVQVLPLYEEDMIAGRWLATGRYAGGLPGARAEPGTPVRFAGADFLRVADGRIAECWSSFDAIELTSQLKMLDAM